MATGSSQLTRRFYILCRERVRVRESESEREYGRDWPSNCHFARPQHIRLFISNAIVRLGRSTIGRGRNIYVSFIRLEIVDVYGLIATYVSSSTDFLPPLPAPLKKKRKKLSAREVFQSFPTRRRHSSNFEGRNFFSEDFHAAGILSKSCNKKKNRPRRCAIHPFRAPSIIGANASVSEKEITRREFLAPAKGQGR